MATAGDVSVRSDGAIVNGLSDGRANVTASNIDLVSAGGVGTAAAPIELDQSTGGVLNKKAGRIGDTPIIGSGAYAKNGIGAISSTGEGEYFMRTVAAYQVAARIELLGESVGAAAGYTVSQVHDLGGEGGIIAIGPRGEVSMPFNTSGMYRAAIDAWGKKTVGVL